MPLHRDIHWLGRQWAVTGHGLQLINQKQMGYYDIEAARLWDARVTEVQSKAWIDRPDFDKALEIARGKFTQLAPADLPPPPAPIGSPPPLVRATPPAAPRAPLDATSVPSIEELLARLKSKSAATAPGEALAPVPPKPEPLGVEPRKVEPSGSELPQAASFAPEPSRAEPGAFEAPKAESLTIAPAKADSVTANPIKSELPTSELPKPPNPEPRQTASIALESAKPEARRVEPPRVEAPKVEAPKPEPAKPEPPRSEAVASRGLGAELRQTPRVKVPEAPRPTPVIAVVRRPARAAWPVFERKIAGSARFVRPWRVTSARWRGPSPGLPPRP
ncbi:hypothetical protein QA635_22925 [Bradyrhizobium brasilense]|uniref:hypothetical protein n=1 Tax=Bradyrhizobium brasilense TaxID=1419277 RepID=UPI0024B0FDDB|nr:hypothetical protein [Bradyrhizobium australafricanum]WFU29468.1 hypothetical protein QA635_22925 [Bradyrhizobium australafricanum]